MKVFKIYSLVTAISLMAVTNLLAQVLQWEKRYDFITPRGIAQGLSYSEVDSTIGILSSASNGYNGWVLKINPTTGDTIKTKYFVNDFVLGYMSPIKAHPNGGYLVAVWDTFNPSNNTDTTYLRFLRLDKNLNTTWDIRLGTNKRDNHPTDIFVKDTAEYYIFQDAGNYDKTGYANMSKFSVIYYNETTNTTWYKNFEFTKGFADSRNIINNQGNNISLFGKYSIVGYDKPLLIKLSEQGDSLHSKHLFLNETSVFAYTVFNGNAVVTPNNNILMAGVLDSTTSGFDNEYPFVAKVDSNYNTLWKKIIVSLKNTVEGAIWSMVTQTEGDTVCLVSVSWQQNKIWLYKLNGINGSIIDSLEFQSGLGTFSAYFSDLIHVDNAIYITGECDNGSGLNTYVAKISGVGKPATSETTGIKKYKNFAMKSSVTLYPNPASDLLNVEVEGEGIFELYNAIGQKLFSELVNGKTQIDVSRYPIGSYEYQYHTRSYTQGGKIIVKR